MQTKIDSFRGEFGFLSNFYSYHCGFTAEHFYQAAKTTDPLEALSILYAPSAREAKKRGKKCKVRENWDIIKLDIMEAVLREKFSYPEMRELLLTTGNVELIEGNTWGDTFWGVCKGVGQNHLGKLLMKIRTELREENPTW